MWLRERVGLRFPVTTAVVFAVTAATNAVQFAVSGMLPAWQRTPAGLHGQWWRTATSLFVQDGGVFGAVVNLGFLLVLGTLAEQILRPGGWLGCYFGAGLVGELAGYAWQPDGGGNSVAVCGLAGALVVALLRGARLPATTPVPVLYWCGVLLATITYPLVAVGLAAGMLCQVGLARGLPVNRPAALAAVAAGLVLAAARNIHGAALLAGIALGVAAVPRPHRSPE